MKSISDYKNINSGSRCLILGSGPSINELDLRYLRDEITFCANWFINHDEFESLNVNYYCAYDFNFVDPHPNSEWLAKLSEYKIEKFFPVNWQKLQLPLENINYVKYSGEEKVYIKNEFSVDPINTGLFDGASVVVNLCIPLAIYMGITEIILLGCDSQYNIKGKDLSEAYFYDIKDHHTSTNHDESTEKIWQANLFKSYEVVNNYCVENGVSITNCSGGALEIFPRKKYEDIIN